MPKTGNSNQIKSNHIGCCFCTILENKVLQKLKSIIKSVSNKSCSPELIILNINDLKKRSEEDSGVILTFVIKIGPTRNSNLEGTLAIISGVHNLPLPHLVP